MRPLRRPHRLAQQPRRRVAAEDFQRLIRTLVRSLAGECARPRNAKALRPPLHPWCQARRWRRRARRARGRRRCGGLRQPASRPRPTSLVQFARPRPASRADLSPRLLRLLAQSAILSNSGSIRPAGQVCRAASRFPHDRPSAARFGMWTKWRIVRSATGRTAGGEHRAGAQNRTPNQVQSGPAAGACNGDFTGASRSNDGPAPALVAGGRMAFVAASVPNWVGHHHARRQAARALSLRSFAGLPPAAQSGAVAPRSRAPPLRGWRVALARRWRARNAANAGVSGARPIGARLIPAPEIRRNRIPQPRTNEERQSGSRLGPVPGPKSRGGQEMTAPGQSPPHFSRNNRPKKYRANPGKSPRQSPTHRPAKPPPKGPFYGQIIAPKNQIGRKKVGGPPFRPKFGPGGGVFFLGPGLDGPL
jgi:hypothetical protein